MAKTSQNKQQARLFKEKLVPAKPGSDKLFAISYGDEEPMPVECLGMKFPNDEARRAHFLEKLREKLKDPFFRKIEGFPIGDDEDILALSDPPYYTACPNPFIAGFHQRITASLRAAKPLPKRAIRGGRKRRKKRGALQCSFLPYQGAAPKAIILHSPFYRSRATLFWMVSSGWP